MTTFAELKTQAAALLADPSLKTFDTADLGYFINAGIAEVSRLAPQRNTEDVALIDGSLTYKLHGGEGNLVANPSFESGDATLLAGLTSVGTGDTELTGGWVPSATMNVWFIRSPFAKSGLRTGLIRLAALEAAKWLYQDIPVNPDTTYYVSGWHWKGYAGGESNAVRFHTLDSGSSIVTTDVLSHLTTASTPTKFTGTITIPASGVSFIRVVLQAEDSPLERDFYFEDISVTEDATAGVADNSRDAIEVRRVEAWTNSFDPARLKARIARSDGYDSESGWEFWAGDLRIPLRILNGLDTAADFLRVWMYAPYDKLIGAGQVTDLTFELEQAVMSYVRQEALARLSHERDLYSQWQTRSGNTDVSPAALMNALTIAREDWRRKSRAIMVLREPS